jgi:hypothetical protein
MRTGDVVFYKPSQETWTVAWADHRYVLPCGWPEEYVKREDCELVKECSDEEHWKFVRELARPNSDDERRRACWFYLEAHLAQECARMMGE